MKRRVVVTGMGAVTPLGNDVPTTWERLLAGRSGIARIARFDPSNLDVQIAGEVKDFDPEALLGRRAARRNDRFTLFAIEATRQAVEDAGLEFEQEDGRRGGAVIGSSIGGVLSIEESFQAFEHRGPRRVSPFLGPMMMPNAPAAIVALTYGLHGPSFALVSACASGVHAIGEAAEIIRRGRTDLMICGGSDAPILGISLSGFANMRNAISTRNDDPEHASRPFDADRDGFVLGEGAGILVIESLDHARQRDARIYCEIAGYGISIDAHHMAAPDDTGQWAAWAIETALQDAEMAPDEVDYVNAHGTGTPLNDPIETRAIRAAFGPHADRLAVSSTKSMIGHPMGAAGAIEAIACVKSLETGWVHPTVNLQTPDPECDLDYVPNQARRTDPRVALSNSFGFGGHNGCLILSRLPET
jgi:3-oxoacyl-[acyl-carrier-protein] synthase II